MTKLLVQVKQVSKNTRYSITVCRKAAASSHRALTVPQKHQLAQRCQKQGEIFKFLEGPSEVNHQL